MTSIPNHQNGASVSDIWTKDYVNEEHIAAFAEALSSPDSLDHPGDQSPSSPKSPPIPIDDQGKSTGPSWNNGPEGVSEMLGGDLGRSGRARVERLTATSDFAPIHQKVSRKPSRATQQGWTYHLIRWPLLGFILFIISVEFGAYVFTRQVVNVFEWVMAWRGHKRVLRRELRNATTYEEWVAAAKKLDHYLGFDDWKEAEEDSFFDYILVKRVRRTLARLRTARDTRGVMDALAVCVRSNFAGTEGVRMYSETFYGTKNIVETHINEVVASLDYVRTATDVSLEEKRAFFRAVNKNYGSSALCLSGGASFGYYHFGVVKAFLDADLLPRVVTGTSAGGLVAALLCTRTDAELREILVPELADKITACEDPFYVWIQRFWKTGARFSTLEWARKAMFFTHGSLTFKEAYERTGRALNVSVVPSDRHSPTILLNHLTAPSCLIWSAIIASAAVPGILNPVVLMAKDRNGQVKPHNLGGSRFKDGSLREDIPLGSLHTQFNCNFSIVSQTNPHIHLFFFAPRGSVGRPVAHRKGKGWRGGFILSALESYIKLDLSKHFKVIRDLDLLPQILQSDWSGVFLQRFSGDLTLTPRSTVRDWTRILSDPNRAQLQRMLEVGQKVSFPALRMVRNRMMIERAILRGRAEVRAAMQRDRTTNDQGSPFPHPDGLTVTSQIPIESDADVGFASRSRKRGMNAGISAPDLLGLNRGTSSRQAGGTAASVRRRRGTTRSEGRRRASELFLASDTESGEQERERERHQTRSTMPSPVASRNYASTIGDTFRHVRASSLAGFGSNFSPFRATIRQPPPVSDDHQTYGQNGGVGSGSGSGGGGQRRQGSRMSISRWFGAASDSEDEEEDGDMALRIDSPTNGLSGDDDHVVGDGSVERDHNGDYDGAVQTSSEDEEDGVVGIPGGERVNEAEVRGSTLVPQGQEAVREQSGQTSTSKYTPPGQDRDKVR